MTPEEKKEYHRKYWEKYYPKNKDRILKQQKKYTERNKEKINKRKRDYEKVWREKNKEKIRQRKRNRRLKLRFQIFQRDNFTCQYCGRKAPAIEIEIDHIKPKSKGGKNNPENYLTACADCNNGKGDYILNEFLS